MGVLGLPLVAGLDEAGRGPLAGPVTAGCVILDADFPLGLLDDSKKLPEKKRLAAERAIKESSCWGLGVVGAETIDAINILQASLLAMKLAYRQLWERLPDWCRARGIAAVAAADIRAIADGTRCPDISCPVRCEPKADGTYPAVMAASIIAKVGRDRLMYEYDRLYPQYGYARHKGYPTAEHRRICRERGPSPIQRRTFSY